jgi:limonene-1,2-epoxide hydrolase
VVSVFSFEGRRIVAVRDYASMEAAQAGMARGQPEAG